MLISILRMCGHVSVHFAVCASTCIRVCHESIDDR